MKFNRALSFYIKGRTAHFKKYYSNKSSLSYILPTRTVLMGMIASILEYPRDSYYEILSPEIAKFGVQIVNPVYKHIECMNYLKDGGGHTQVRLQLVFPKDAESLKYRVYFTHKNNSILDELENKLINQKTGYGLFLGQRQFRAVPEFIRSIDELEIIKDYTGLLNSLTFTENIKSIDSSEEVDLVVENMPVHFDKVESGREPSKMDSFCFEENGQKIKGNFNQVIALNNQIISFYTPVGEV